MNESRAGARERDKSTSQQKKTVIAQWEIEEFIKRIHLFNSTVVRSSVDRGLRGWMVRQARMYVFFQKSILLKCLWVRNSREVNRRKFMISQKHFTFVWLWTRIYIGWSFDISLIYINHKLSQRFKWVRFRTCQYLNGVTLVIE